MPHDAPPSPPRVAIVMRGRNRPVLLARALASVLDQSCDDWRLVLVNEGGDPAPVEMLLARHDSGFAGRATTLHLPAAGSTGTALNAALRHVRTMGGCAFLAFHDEEGSWDPDFLRRMTAVLDDGDPGVVAAVSAWTEVDERLHNGELMETRRVPIAVEPAMAELDAALGAGRFPAIAALCRAEALDAATVRTLPADGFDRGLGLALLKRGDVALCAERLAFRHRLDTATGNAPDVGPGVPDGVAGRNAVLRALATQDPAWFDVLTILAERDARAVTGPDPLLHRVLANTDRNGAWGHHRHEDLQQRLVRVEAALERVERQLDHVGRTTLPVWRRAVLKLRRHRDRRAGANAPGQIDAAAGTSA